jgi:hypothetical protein
MDQETAAAVDACLRRLCENYVSPVFPDSRYAERLLALADDPQMQTVFDGGIRNMCTVLASAGVIRGRQGARTVNLLSSLTSPNSPTASASSSSTLSSDESTSSLEQHGVSPKPGNAQSRQPISSAVRLQMTSAASQTFGDHTSGPHRRQRSAMALSNSDSALPQQRRPQCHFCHEAHHMADCALFKEARAKYHLRQALSSS